ncbi:MAG: hypothetical protein ABH842_04700 [Candidatus Micrarchaeota archaeon]
MRKRLVIPERPRDTLSDASFTTSIAGYTGSRRKTTSMRKTFGIFDPLAFGKPLPLNSRVEPEEQLPDRRLLYRASYLEGFVETEMPGFVEFTRDGPKVFTIGKEGVAQLYPHDLPTNLFVSLNPKLAMLYAQDPLLSRRICSMLLATSSRPFATFLTTSFGLHEDHSKFFIALSDITDFHPVVRLSMRNASFTLVPSRNDASALHWEGRAVFSSQVAFTVGREIYIYQEFDQSAVSYYLGSGENVLRYRSLYFGLSHDGRLYIN